MPGSFAGLFLELKRFTLPILLLPFFSFCLADTYAQCPTVAYNVGGGAPIAQEVAVLLLRSMAQKAA
jgi:hypothetical protein